MMRTYRALRMARALAEEQLEGLDEAFRRADEEVEGNEKGRKGRSRRYRALRMARAMAEEQLEGLDEAFRRADEESGDGDGRSPRPWP